MSHLHNYLEQTLLQLIPSSEQVCNDFTGTQPTTNACRCLNVSSHTSFLMFDRNIGSRLSINKSVDACFGSDAHVTSLEHVQARLTLSYNRRGNLAIHLISPAGTRSTLLHPRYKRHSWTYTQTYKLINTNRSPSCLLFSCRPHDYSSEGFNDWAFMTTHSWDENPKGEWTLEIENVAGASDYGKTSFYLCP